MICPTAEWIEGPVHKKCWSGQLRTNWVVGIAEDAPLIEFGPCKALVECLSLLRFASCSYHSRELTRRRRDRRQKVISHACKAAPLVVKFSETGGAVLANCPHEGRGDRRQLFRVLRQSRLGAVGHLAARFHYWQRGHKMARWRRVMPVAYSSGQVPEMKVVNEGKLSEA